jgi:hypothetical protein
MPIVQDRTALLEVLGQNIVVRDHVDAGAHGRILLTIAQG